MKKIITIFVAIVLIALAFRIQSILDGIGSLIHPIVIEKEKIIYETDVRRGGIFKLKGKNYCVEEINIYESLGDALIQLIPEKECN